MRHEEIGSALLATASLLGACSVGSGTGELTVTFSAPECGKVDKDIKIKPTFFGAQAVEDILVINVQKGSGVELVSDGIQVEVLKASQVSTSYIGAPLALSADTEKRGLVYVTLYLNETCRPGMKDLPLVYLASSGTIIFDAIYAPKVDEKAVETSATLENVVLSDTDSPETRHATLAGFFRFLYARGRPAQRYP